MSGRPLGHKFIDKRIKHFWNRVNKNGPIHNTHGQCWIWTGPLGKKGYGCRVSVCGTKWLPHRFSYYLSNGEISDGMCVLHKCDNPQCVNPSHLFEGTYNDNNQDRVKKGRSAIGTMSGKAKITEEDVRYVLSEYSESTDSRNYGLAKRLSNELGVHVSTIMDIKNRNTWGHVNV